jgi:hypothetical protein
LNVHKWLAQASHEAVGMHVPWPPESRSADMLSECAERERPLLRVVCKCGMATALSVLRRELESMSVSL